MFDIIETTYENGDGILIFNLPDFHGRIPNANSIGLTGRMSEHILSIDQLPIHQYDKGTLILSVDGEHSHSYSDPGHGHQYSATTPIVRDATHPWHAEWGHGFYHQSTTMEFI